jgi:hypothetical protein
MAQQPPTTSISKIMVNLRNKTLNDASHSALSKGLHFSVSVSVLPTEVILGGVEKTINMCLKKLQRKFDRKL